MRGHNPGTSPFASTGNSNDANAIDIWGLRTNVDSGSRDWRRSSQSTAARLPTGPALVNPRAAKTGTHAERTGPEAAGVRGGSPLIPPPPPSALGFFVPDNLAFTLYIVRAQDVYPPLGSPSARSDAKHDEDRIGAASGERRSGERVVRAIFGVFFSARFALLSGHCNLFVCADRGRAVLNSAGVGLGLSLDGSRALNTAQRLGIRFCCGPEAGRSAIWARMG